MMTSSLIKNKLFDYFSQNNNMETFHKMLHDILGPRMVDQIHSWLELYQCYTYLYRNEMDYIIYDILEMPMDNDEYYICMVAIDNDLMPVIERLIQKGFDFGKTIVVNSYALVRKCSVLDYCVEKDKHEMFKFFVENHNVCLIDAIEFDYNMIHKICKNETDNDFFDYYINHILLINAHPDPDPKSHLCYLLDICCYHNSYEKVKKIINLCPDTANMISKSLFIHVNLRLEILKFLVDHGLMMDNMLLNSCCYYNKLDLIEFMLLLQ